MEHLLEVVLLFNKVLLKYGLIGLAGAVGVAGIAFASSQATNALSDKSEVPAINTSVVSATGSAIAGDTSTSFEDTGVVPETNETNSSDKPESSVGDFSDAVGVYTDTSGEVGGADAIIIPKAISGGDLGINVRTDSYLIMNTAVEKIEGATPSENKVVVTGVLQSLLDHETPGDIVVSVSFMRTGGNPVGFATDTVGVEGDEGVEDTSHKLGAGESYDFRCEYVGSQALLVSKVDFADIEGFYHEFGTQLGGESIRTPEYGTS